MCERGLPLVYTGKYTKHERTVLTVGQSVQAVTPLQAPDVPLPPEAEFKLLYRMLKTELELSSI